MSAYALPGLFPPLHGFPWEATTPSTPHADKESCQQGECSDEERVHLSVRTAKVDALHLIQTAVAKPSNSKRRHSSRHHAQCCMKPQPEELAVQFELEIGFAGKQCTVVRSLFRMRQLRQELLVEQEHLPSLLPPLPPLISSNNHNLTMLQAALFDYVPALEDWLRTLFASVPMNESPTLTHFVLEPLCFLHTVSPDVYWEFTKTRKQILSSLESIAEEQHADE